MVFCLDSLWLSGFDVRGSRMFSGEKVTKIAANVVEAGAKFRIHRLGLSLMVYAFPAPMAQARGWLFEESCPRPALSC
jgi:hypothetical protein